MAFEYLKDLTITCITFKIWIIMENTIHGKQGKHDTFDLSSDFFKFCMSYQIWYKMNCFCSNPLFVLFVYVIWFILMEVNRENLVFGLLVASWLNLRLVNFEESWEKLVEMLLFLTLLMLLLLLLLTL